MSRLAVRPHVTYRVFVLLNHRARALETSADAAESKTNEPQPRIAALPNKFQWSINMSK